MSFQSICVWGLLPNYRACYAMLLWGMLRGSTTLGERSYVAALLVAASLLNSYTWRLVSSGLHAISLLRPRHLQLVGTIS